jgi:hypothetical protein
VASCAWLRRRCPDRGAPAPTRPARHRQRIAERLARQGFGIGRAARGLVRHLELNHASASRTMRATPCPSGEVISTSSVSTRCCQWIFPDRLSSPSGCRCVPAASSWQAVNETHRPRGTRGGTLAQPADSASRKHPDQAPHQGFNRRRVSSSNSFCGCACRLVCHSLPASSRCPRAHSTSPRWAAISGSGRTL